MSFALILLVIFIIILITFLYLITWIVEHKTTVIDLQEYLELPNKKRWKFNQQICVYCKLKQPYFYYNPLTEYMEFICEKCKIFYIDEI